MRHSIAEIVAKAQTLPSDEEKVAWLKQNGNIPALKIILKNMYDLSVKFLIPNVPPPWKKNDYTDVQGMLYNEARRLKIFVEGGGYDNLNQVKRETLFISLLEDIDNDDAELLCKMIAQKPLDGLPLSVVSSAFPDLFPTIGASTTNA